MRFPSLFVLFFLGVSCLAPAEVSYYQHFRGSDRFPGNDPSVTWGNFQIVSDAGRSTKLNGVSLDRDSAAINSGYRFQEGDRAPKTEDGILLGDIQDICGSLTKVALTGGPVGAQALYNSYQIIYFHGIPADLVDPPLYVIDLFLRTGMTLPTPDAPEVLSIGDVSVGAIVQLSGDEAKNSAIVIGADRTVLVRKGDPAPGTGTSFAGFMNLSRGISGPLAFSAALNGDAAAGTGLWQRSGNELVLLAREGDAVPDLPGSVLGRIEGALAMDEEGGILFQAALADAPSAASLWHWRSGSVSLVARPGDSAGDGDTFTAFQSPGLDEIGSAYFYASLNDGTTSGVYVRTRQGELKRMLRLGQAIQYRRAGEAELRPATVTAIDERLSFYNGFVYAAATLDGTESCVLMMLDMAILNDFGPKITVAGPKRIVTRRSFLRLHGTVSGPRPVKSIDIYQSARSGKKWTFFHTHRVRISADNRWTLRLNLRRGPSHQLQFYASDIAWSQSRYPTPTVKIRRVVK